ncbi:MAG TPA: hypothetical protein VFD07_03915 [Candidatus Krumholzibacteria bacterium]|nr:hypothetical protein [Candidatus Krumholzibacteria bacterium]
MIQMMRFRGLSFKSVSMLTVLFTIVIATCTTPRVAHAIRDQFVEIPGYGSGEVGVPRQGDDDQPTIAPPPTRRTTVQVSEPDMQTSGSATAVRASNASTVRRLFVRGLEMLRRLFVIAP